MSSKVHLPKTVGIILYLTRKFKRYTETTLLKEDAKYKN